MKQAVKDDGLRITDELWSLVERVLPARKSHPLGCHNPRIPDRAAMDGILFVLRTGIRWNALDDSGICTCSSAYRRFREWRDAGVFAVFMEPGFAACEALKQIDWSRLVPSTPEITRSDVSVVRRFPPAGAEMGVGSVC